MEPNNVVIPPYLLDRIMVVIKRIDKRLDEIDERQQEYHEQPSDWPVAVAVPQPPYGHPPLVDAGFHPPHAQPPDPPDWQQPYRPYNWGANADLTLRTSFPQPPQTDPIYTKLDHPLAAVTELESHMGATDQILWNPSPPQQPNPGPPSIQPSWQQSEGPLYEHQIALYNEQQPVQASQPTCWKLGPPDELRYAAVQYHHQDNNQLPYCYGSAPAYELDPYRQPHSTPPEHLAYFGRSSYVQQQGSAAEYHSWVHQQLPPQPVLDQPSPQQQPSSSWSSTSHCHPAAPLPADVVPPLNTQHVSLASEAMTNLLSNQAPVSTISTSMLSSCFSSFAPVSVCDEAGTTSLTNKSVVLGRAAVPEETISQSEPSFASAPQSLQNAHMDVEVVKMSSKTMAVDLNFTTMNEKFKKDQVLGYTGESNRLQFKSTYGHGEAMDHRSTTLDVDARLIPPHNDRPCLSILGCDDKIPVLSLNYGTPKGSLVIFVGDDERRHSTIWCVFDPGGDTSPMFSLQLCSLLLFPP